MTRWVLAFSSMDDPESGGRFGERLDTKEVEDSWASFARDLESESGEGVSVFGGYVVD